MGKIYIGTSGWSYDSWEGTLYPEGLKPKDRLPEYCKTFKTSEINNTFYSLPTKSAVKNWYEETPTDFIFAVKASRFITHNKKLKDSKSSFRKFFTAVDKLEDKLGPILFQPPPRFKYNGERLKEFLKALPKGHRYTFEFRDQTWLNDECYETLEQHKQACAYMISVSSNRRRLPLRISCICACMGRRRKPMGVPTISARCANMPIKSKSGKSMAMSMSISTTTRRRARRMMQNA